MTAAQDYEHQLTEVAFERLQSVPGMKIYGPRRPNAAHSEFHRGRAASTDLSDILNRRGVAIRAGHHCTMRSTICCRFRRPPNQFRVLQYGCGNRRAGRNLACREVFSTQMTDFVSPLSSWPMPSAGTLKPRLAANRCDRAWSTRLAHAVSPSVPTCKRSRPILRGKLNGDGTEQGSFR
ncbi:MAG: aminotransferase class V-fold PLP-dependent enzyme [Planctomycetaceae bacterium]